MNGNNLVWILLVSLCLVLTISALIFVVGFGKFNVSYNNLFNNREKTNGLVLYSDSSNTNAVYLNDGYMEVKKVSCHSDIDCDDSDSSTTDICENPGTSVSYCRYVQYYSSSHHTSDVFCNNNTDCNDNNNLTLDKCNDAGTTHSSCQHDVIACMNSGDCNDNNSSTIDRCNNPATTNSSCSHDTIVCSSDVECSDNNGLTLDSCLNPGANESSCQHQQIACLNVGDCNDNNSSTIDVCNDPGLLNSTCTHTPNVNITCSTDLECNDNIIGTIDVCENPGTNESVCTHTPNNPVVICSSNTECNDLNDHTEDICNNAGTPDSTCSNNPIVCLIDSECNDNNDFTLDKCNNAGTVDSSCSHTNITCSNNNQCDDLNDHTADVCNSPGTVDSACSHNVLQCINDSECNDNNALTLDSCTNANTVNSQCKHDQIVCNTNTDCGVDGNVGSNVCSENNTNVVQNYQSFTCVNPGTVNSSCSNVVSQSNVQACSYQCSNGSCITQPAVCGNSIVESEEQCDDGNLLNGDGCSSTCKVETNNFYTVDICDWQDCKTGAASVSVDDSYTSCRAELNAKGLNGTYYLMDTVDFSQSDWNTWKAIAGEGHEIGPHTETHGCNGYTNSELTSELTAQISEISSHLNISTNEIASMAWPCGETNTQMENAASQLLISSRGYFINQLEDKNPTDFMNLNSFNTPYWNGPPYDPPAYISVIDDAISQNKWANLVFHNECTDDGSINYLATKTNTMWVAPVGIVAKYIKERQNTQINNLIMSGNVLSFTATNTQNHALFNKEISLNISTFGNNVTSVKVNNVTKTFTLKGNYVIFNFVPSGNDQVQVTFAGTTPVCGNSILESREQCDDGNLLNGDGCSSSCTIENQVICQYAISATATSEQASYLASYATGAPNADGECTTSVGGVSWAPTNWNVAADLELTFNTPVYPTNFTVYGDQGMSWVSMSLFNADTNTWVVVNNVLNNQCVYTQTFNPVLPYKTNKIKLSKTTFDWSATDAVQLCGEIS